jgi:hypothetical protein
MAALSPMTILAVQYLESEPANVAPDDVRLRLRQAFEALPISMILLGWHLSERLEGAVAEETARNGAMLYRWHPLLASDVGFHLPKEWRTVGLDENQLSGFQDMPEFTFVCPNRADVQDWIAERLESEALRGMYQGFFLDRMRFPSPAVGFPGTLACFCQTCRRIAYDSGLDLESVRRFLGDALAHTGGSARIIGALFKHHEESPTLLKDFLDFRTHTITRVVHTPAKLIKAHGLQVGLDCFSPALTYMVGQDIEMLTRSSDWVKIMTYPRVFGPAGLPFELLGFADWLSRRGMDQSETLKLLTEVTRLPMPTTMDGLRGVGLGSEVIGLEIEKSRNAGVNNLFAGLALVEMESVHESTVEQIALDVEASRGADGLALSWDLWHIPSERLPQIRALLEG